MLPIYFLSIVLNALTGIILAFGKDETEAEGLSLSLNNQKTRFIIGALAFATGVLKILSPVAGNVPVVGDLFPALAGLTGGFILVYEFFRQKPDLEQLSEKVTLELIAGIINKNRKMTGYICIAAAALHFIFYSVIFL